MFEEKVIRNINGLEEFNSIKYPCNIGIYDFNSTIEIPSDIIQPNSVDMVVTSPPYGDSRTTVAYGQFSRWANEWFNFENAKTLDNLLMGGRVQKEELFETKSIKSELDEIKSIDPKRNLEVVSFLNDYSCSIKNVASVIKSGGVVCYVVGNRTVKGVQIPLDYFTAEMFEKNGFISSLDQFVWENVCAKLQEWKEKGYLLLPMSVNVSRNDIFQGSLVDIFSGLIKKYDIDPQYLHLEITESAYAECGNRIVNTIEELRKLGFTIEMDDFGSGYSSLNC